MISLWSWCLLIYFTVTLPSEIMSTSFTVGKNFSLVGVHHRNTVILSNGVISRLSHFMREVKQQNIVPLLHQSKASETDRQSPALLSKKY